jgi:hypothetical protein
LVHDTLVPQLLAVIVTLPPLAGSDVGEAETEHDGVVVPPLQLIVTLLAVSTLDVQLPPLMVIVRPSEGVGATRQADETAAASTRLTDRNMCMAYLEKRRQLAAMAQRKRRARLSTNSRFFCASPCRIRQAFTGCGQTVHLCSARPFEGRLVALFPAHCKKRAGLRVPPFDHLVRNFVTSYAAIRRCARAS